MSIFPLPVFEADADPHHRSAMTDEEIYARIEPPKTIVVKYGSMKLVGEFPYHGSAKPGCGSKLVARTLRGTELVEMLTTTCENAGCGKSVTRQEMLEYIENSGGKDYPFHTKGKILRVATIDDINRQSELNNRKPEYIKACKALINQYQLPMKLVDVELILGEELLTFYYMSEGRVDFRDLVRDLASEFKARIEMRQVGARDEARLVADYERCGQHCCCKNFLKVLKPVSMRSAKTQKATLDPLKISGRCGRLMCCLRYEDQTYRQLQKNLPKLKKRVGTSEGPGIVIETKILVQLVLVRLEHDRTEIAVPVEELMDPETCPKPGEAQAKREAEARQLERENDPFRGLSEDEVRERTDDSKRKKRKRSRGKKRKSDQQDSFREQSQEQEASGKIADVPGEVKPKKKRRRRKRKAGANDGDSQPQGQQEGSGSGGGQPPAAEGQAGAKPKRRRRRRRKPKGDGGGGSSGESSS
jgi:cell fate regulator YaaT (PSP1 superfamily)